MERILIFIILKATLIQSVPLDLSSQRLPDRLPDGDPVDYALPIFLTEPARAAFASKERDASLSCSAAHALDIYWECNDVRVKEADGGGGQGSASVNRSRGTDPATGAAFMATTLAVSKSEVLDIIGDFVCVCIAVSNRGKATSKPTTISVAYLRKEFVTPPYSSHVEVGKQTELRCHPPQGKPEPEVIGWLRNGVPIDTESDNNFIISSTGHLLLLQARLTDTANYSCVAANIARQRTSPSALLKVYIPGSWGEWSEWSACNVDCGRGVRERQRKCDSPAPFNDGPGCEGPAIQKKSCSQVCPAQDGDWSTWTAWSTCSADCLHVRRRTCTSPPPANGGRYCQGKDIMSRNCTGGNCRAGSSPSGRPSDDSGVDVAGQSPSTMTGRGGDLPPQHQLPVVVYTPPFQQPVNSDSRGISNDDIETGRSGDDPANDDLLSTSDLTLYIGLAVALVVLILVLVVLVRLVHKRQRWRGVRRGPASPGNRNNQHSRAGYTPAGSYLMDGGPVHPNKDSPGPSAAYKPSHGGYSPAGIPGNQPSDLLLGPAACYEYAYNVDSQQHANNQAARGGLVSVSGFLPAASMIGGNSGGAANSHHQRQFVCNGGLEPVSSSTMPRPVSEHLYEQPMRVFTSGGVGQQLLSSGGQKVNSPSCNGGNWSPASSLERHSLVRDSNHSSLSKTSNHSSGNHNNNNNNNGKLANDIPSSLCLPRCADLQQVAWTTVGEAGTRISIPRSAVSLTVPQGAIEPGRSEEVWISVVDNSQAEGGRQTHRLQPSLDPANQCLVTPIVLVGPAHLTAHLKKPVVVSIPHIGGSALPQVQVLQCDSLGDGGANDLAWRVVAVSDQEDANSSASVYKDSTMCQLVTERLAAFALVTNPKELLHNVRNNINTTGAALNIGAAASSSSSSTSGVSSMNGVSPVSSTASSSSGNTAFRIPLATKQSLARLLDTRSLGTSDCGGDWRQLADRLGVNRYTTFFASQPSPTEAILNLWEARNRESTAVAGLVNTLRGMGRFDAADVLDKDASWP